ncbi:MAG: OmpA family protein [Bacteroidia bacterium]|jgi:outer membrane protein OmpA-like peptidoglycan-associated protein
MRVFFITFFCAFSLYLFAQDGGKKSVLVTVKTLDESNDPLKVSVEVVDNETKEVVTSLESASGGDTKIKLAASKNYTIFFSKTGYLFQSVVVKLQDSVARDKKLKEVVMQKVTIGKKVILRSTSFDDYQKVLIEESMPDVDRIIKLLEDTPQLQIELGGYTDNFGSVNLTTKVSEERAKALMDLLVEKGVDEGRLQYKGYGPIQPIANNLTEEGRVANNRIELKVIGLDYVPLSPAELKKKRANAKKTENNTENPEENPVDDTPKDTIKTDAVPMAIVPTEPVSDSLLKIDYKGMFIADKKPMANSTVNLLTDQGQVFQTTKTDENGSFQFIGVPAEKELRLGLDEKESKKFKSVQLADTAGVVVEDLVKVDGKFEHRILPSEKVKLGQVYVVDPELKIRKPKPKNSNQMAIVTGRVLDDRGNPIKADVEAVDLSSGTTVQKVTSTSTGEFAISIAAGKNYDIAVSKPGYSFQTVNAIIPEVAGYEKKVGDVSLQKVETGKKIILNNIFFDVNQSTLRKESYGELGRVLKLMNDISSLRIEISGHTDNIGSVKSNKTLSEQRAKAVKDYLIANGANKDRLTSKGYGSTQPVANNATEGGRQLNRRTEFKVLEVNQEEVKNKEEPGETAGNKRNTTADDPEDTAPKEMPEAFKQYDIDKNGSISYEEVIAAIDLYFEQHPNGNTQKKEELTSLFDYYFEK